MVQLFLISTMLGFFCIRLQFFKYLLQFWLLSYRAKGHSTDLFVDSLHIYNVLAFLKAFSFIKAESLVDLTVIDELHISSEKGKQRFRLVYTLLSIKTNMRINIHTYVNNSTLDVESIQSLFFNASWLEREAWDLFGISFTFNTDLRRLLLDYQFKGFALRKDFPVTGYVELFYFDYEARVIYIPVNFTQEPKQFQINASW